MKAGLIAAILLSGCATVQGVGKPISIDWVPLDTQEEVMKACSGDSLVGMQTRTITPMAKGNDSTLGCYVLMANGSCRIYSTRMRSTFGDARDEINRVDGRLFQTMGHELAHCVIGNFHK